MPLRNNKKKLDQICSFKLIKYYLNMCKIKYKKLQVLISEARKNERISDNYATPFINLLKIKLT